MTDVEDGKLPAVIYVGHGKWRNEPFCDSTRLVEVSAERFKAGTFGKNSARYVTPRRSDPSASFIQYFVEILE